MSTWFDEDHRPALVDERHPVDLLEPEERPVDRGLPDFITMVDVIGETYIRGETEITRAAWKFLLKKESRSMRECAKRIGCTPQAISMRVRLLAEQFGYPINNEQKRAMQREVASRSWAKRRRRRATRPPAAADEQLEDNSPSPKKGGRP